ncbi:hypothetical protein ACE6H2_023987 [Prunus campanulata]
MGMFGDGRDDVVRVDICYEKLPHTCYLCGSLDHMENECSKYVGEGLTDLDKPYGKWFLFGPDYCRLPGRRFGLAFKPWSVRALELVEEEEEKEETAAMRRGEEDKADGDKNQGDPQLPQIIEKCAVSDVIMSNAEIPLLEVVDLNLCCLRIGLLLLYVSTCFCSPRFCALF